MANVSVVWSKTRRLERGDILSFMLHVENVFRRRTATSDARLRRQIDATQMSDFTKPMDYLEAMQDLFARADRQGVTLAESDKVHRLLQGLSPEFSYASHLIYVW